MNKKNIKWVIAGLAVAVLFGVFIYNNQSPEFFDIFGFLSFLYLFIVGVWMFRQKRKVPNWIRFPILVIGLLGSVVDGYIVVQTFIL